MTGPGVTSKAEVMELEPHSIQNQKSSPLLTVRCSLSPPLLSLFLPPPDLPFTLFFLLLLPVSKFPQL